MNASLTRRPETFAAFVLLLGLATIAGAWGFQLIGGYVPCALCLKERVPYYVGLPAAVVALVAARMGGPSWLVRGALAVTAIAFAWGAYLGVYHAGAEWGWWAGPTDCGTGGAGGVTTTGDLLGQLDKIRIVSCTEASFRFFGLSFAGWNAVISAVLAMAAIFGATRKQVHASTAAATAAR
jgi:disulfide bond formation protein DsbB